ncbi:hypothetical protein [Salarchaeum sp. JOR-1]|uniref:hypothetical protein n=1 Tax=Salarchaeum sp. JOR-1 TaxID=2599399 RepID=UPI001198683D|nr:hypothetical protein [Salarchaeum sp. JOR-1]QDX40430.1 hypothetical protein FQU85_05765 [Salarchaeum sp. JOR-1]
MEDRPPIGVTLILVGLALLVLTASRGVTELAQLNGGSSGIISGMAFLGGAALLVVSLAFLADHALN